MADWLNSIDISTGSRYFFFNSLLNYGDEGKSIYQAASGILNQPITQNGDEIDGEAAIQQALEFLASARDQEAKIEAQYFKNKIMNHPFFKKKKNKVYLKNLNSIFQNDQKIIDYNKFLILINLIGQDNKNVKNWENKLAQVQEEYQQLASFAKEVSKGSTKRVERRPDAFIADIFRDTDFGNQRKRSGYNMRASMTKKIDAATMGSKRNEILTGLIPEIKGIAEQYISQRNLNDAQRRAFVSELASSFIEETYTILYNEQQSTELVDLDTIKQRFFNTTLENGTINKEHTRVMQKLKDTANILLRNLDLLEEEGKRMSPEIKEKIKIQQGKLPTGFTQDVRKYLLDFLKEIKIKDADGNTVSLDTSKLEKWETKSDSERRKKKAKQEYWKNLTQILRPIMLADKNATKNKFTKQDYTNYINKIFSQRTKLTITDHTEFDSARTINNITNAVVGVIGGRNRKTDVSGIDAGYVEISCSLPDTQQIVQELLNEYEADYENRVKKFNKEISERLSDETQKYFAQDISYSVESDTRATSEAQKNLAKNILIQKGISDPDEEQIQETLKNLFIIDDSTKYAEFFMPELGFQGGSIGANVGEQIENICKIYEYGGITPLDRDWLIFAVLNCGDALIGSHLRGPLENYFSVVASLLMFRTGGLLAETLKKNSKVSSANNLHLLQLGPILVTNSYILDKLYTELSKGAAQLDAKASGVKATIRNNVNDSDIIKKDTLIEKKRRDKNGNVTEISTFSAGDWNATYIANYPRVQINIAMLGGFLDLLEQFRNLLNNFNP